MGRPAPWQLHWSAEADRSHTGFLHQSVRQRRDLLLSPVHLIYRCRHRTRPIFYCTYQSRASVCRCQAAASTPRSVFEKSKLVKMYADAGLWSKSSEQECPAVHSSAADNLMGERTAKLDLFYDRFPQKNASFQFSLTYKEWNKNNYISISIYFFVIVFIFFNNLHKVTEVIG